MRSNPNTAVRLLDLPKGCSGRVVRLAGDNSFQNRLREMGIVESAQISVLNVNGSVHCQVKDSRFGLSRAAAEEVFVELG